MTEYALMGHLCDLKIWKKLQVITLTILNSILSLLIIIIEVYGHKIVKI